MRTNFVILRGGVGSQLFGYLFCEAWVQPLWYNMPGERTPKIQSSKMEVTLKRVPSLPGRCTTLLSVCVPASAVGVTGCV